MDPKLQAILAYAVYGAVGALVGVMAKERRLKLPRLIVERNGSEPARYIDPGFVGSMCLGAVLAAYFDTRPENAIAWGLASGYAGPSILNSLIDPLLKRLGVQFVPSAELERGETR